MPPICVLCETPVEPVEYKEVEIFTFEGKTIRWIMCYFCAQVVKETFEEK